MVAMSFVPMIRQVTATIPSVAPSTGRQFTYYEMSTVLGKMILRRSPSSSGIIVLKLIAYVLISPFTILEGVIVKVSKKF
jgi:hypothetical protein